MPTRDEHMSQEIPDIVTDPKTGKKYKKGKYLGKGGFARCFELIDIEKDFIYAGKIVSKQMIAKQHQREKMTQEISIQRELNHPHVVKFCSFFEDDNYIYILLELCRKRSLMELHKRRKTITEPEARYFVYQCAEACVYLHNNHIIHRDLKLGNLFINDNMDLKVGDFGLATRVEHDGERKKTLCGTPNYIAPEVLYKKGHSYEVDVWSLGCMIYTLLIGKPPFETTNLKETYSKIKRNEYFLPKHRLSDSASKLIGKILVGDPTKRPTMHDILIDPWFSAGPFPSRLPATSLSVAPRFNSNESAIFRQPLTDTDNMKPSSTGVHRVASGGLLEPSKLHNVNAAPGPSGALGGAGGDGPGEPADGYLSDMCSQLAQILSAKVAERVMLNEADDCEDPAAVPMFWISKWVDYSDKYGLGYTLCDNSVGVLFNDCTRLLMFANGEQLQYIDQTGHEEFCSISHCNTALKKKVTLLKYFGNYMTGHLLKAGTGIKQREGDDMSRLPFLRTWFRTRSAIVLHLSNGTLQINFFGDHTKIILCPVMGALTYIDPKKQTHTYLLSLVQRHGCSKDLMQRLKYAHSMVERLINSRSVYGTVNGKKTASSSALPNVATAPGRLRAMQK